MSKPTSNDGKSPLGLFFDCYAPERLGRLIFGRTPRSVGPRAVQRSLERRTARLGSVTVYHTVALDSPPAVVWGNKL